MSKMHDTDIISYYRWIIQENDRYIQYHEKRLAAGEGDTDWLPQHIEELKRRKAAAERAIEKELAENPPLQPVLL